MANIDFDGLMKMKQEELDTLYEKCECGVIPNGQGKGIPIILPGTLMTREMAEFLNIFAWQGKIFDAKKHLLVNEVSMFHIRAIVAEIRVEPSWIDGKDCIVLDYSKTSKIVKWVRDEIRYVGNGRYLGKVFWEKTRLIDFALEFEGMGP